MKRRLWGRLLIIGGLALTGTRGWAEATPAQKDLGMTMLRRCKTMLQDEYYDPTLGGFDLEGRCQEAEKRIATAADNAAIFRIVAEVFLNLGDPHTRFIAPPRAARVDYGWQAVTVGDGCYVYRLVAKSDAVKKGLAFGDRIESVNGLAANRQTWPILAYLFNSLDPQGGLRVVAVSPAGERRQLDLQAEVKPRARVLDPNSAEYWQLVLRAEADIDRWDDQFAWVDDVLVWRLRRFDNDPASLNEGAGRLAKAKSLVLDLRGNDGGSKEKLLEMLALIFDHPVQVGTIRTRGKEAPLAAAPAARPFRGMVIAVVDAQTGAAAEICARMLQLEDRGVVVGDRTAGDLRSGKFVISMVGTNGVPFAMAVTTARMVMRDGQTLDGGVAPDLPLIPTGADMARRSDPALAKALAQVAKKFTPEEAGKLLPWKLPAGEL
ncbi:MAG TPA: S41 family peptidase [Opitutaceae bacterium]|nr:S41 family peptidase [Opitutaceae bacterium]